MTARVYCRWLPGLLGLLVGLGTVLISGVFAPDGAAQSACEFLPSPEPFNSRQSEEDGVIRIGGLSGRSYVVILPGADESDLALIRPCITDAYLTRSRLGRYLQAGSFERRSEAEALARTLRRNGFRVRVAHRRGVPR
ncbi:MAG: SPOR domain-containing protein [Cyanobacteria bacterium P01_A01_bin.114]